MKPSILYGFISLLLLIHLPPSVRAQADTTRLNRVETDARGREMLLGRCTPDALRKNSFNEWFEANYNQYLLDTASCCQVIPLLKDKNITIFMGTWCGDSKREVPRFMKMLDSCSYPYGRLSLVMVGNADTMYKKSPGHEEEGKNIVRVPTIIIEENGVEMGRIIESPVISLEKDLLAILRGGPYKPNYHGAGKN